MTYKSILDSPENPYVRCIEWNGFKRLMRNSRKEIYQRLTSKLEIERRRETKTDS